MSVINVGEAKCFDETAAKHIRNEIIERHGTLDRFTTVLKLRLILKPLSFDGDITALLGRTTDTFDFASLRTWAADATGSRVMCVTALSGEGKSTLSAALTRLTADGDSLICATTPLAALTEQTQTSMCETRAWLHAWHFCKHSDARRQDAVMVAKSLAYQLGLRFKTIADALLMLDTKAVANLQRAAEALELLVLQPLKAMREADGATMPVFLFDALDEAEPAGCITALSNPLIGIVTALHTAGCLVVTTTRPKPSHIVDALRRRWSDASFSNTTPGSFLQPAKVADGVLSKDWRDLYAKISGRKVFCTVAAALLKQNPVAAAPDSLAAAYAAIFEHGWPKDAGQGAEVKRLLEILMAAREPPSVAALEQLGVRGALSLLPGWTVLFTERDFHVYSIHKSLAEWLKGGIQDEDSDPSHERFVVDVRAGDRALAAHCSQLVKVGRDLSASVDGYALRYIIQHLTAAHEWEKLGVVLMDFDFWTHAFNAGSLEFALLEDVAEAKADMVGVEETSMVTDAHAKVADCLRWLLAEGRFMRQDPLATLQRALAAPSSSCVTAAAQAFHRQPALALVNAPSQWPLDSMTVDCGASVTGVCFSPDGLLMLAAAGKDVQIRKAATGQLVTTLQGHTKDVNCCAWSADNTLLASGSMVCETTFLYLSFCANTAMLHLRPNLIEPLCAVRVFAGRHGHHLGRRDWSTQLHPERALQLRMGLLLLAGRRQRAQRER